MVSSTYRGQLLDSSSNSIHICFYIGLADRTVGFTTIFLISLLLKRAFQIGERRELLSITTAFHGRSHVIPTFSWLRNELDDEWIIDPLKFPLISISRNYNESILNQGKYFAVNSIENQVVLEQLIITDDLESLLSQANFTFMTMNRGRIMQFTNNSKYKDALSHEFGLYPWNAYGCLLEVLLEPKPSIFLPIYDLFLKLTDSSSPSHISKDASTTQTNEVDSSTLKPVIIAIQIRAGDSLLVRYPDYEIELDIFLPFFACAQQIEDFIITQEDNHHRSHQSVQWYLLTDSIPLRQQALNRFGSSKILTATNIVLEHSAKESSVCFGQGETCNLQVSEMGFQTAAAEWWLMSMARYFVVSKSSGYGRTAALHSSHPKNSIYTVTVGQSYGPEGIKCDRDSYTQLEQLASDWSGI